MNKKIILTVMLVCTLAFVAVLAFGQNSPSVRWEYTAIDSGFLSPLDVIQEANRLGREGWEVVTSVGANAYSGANVLIFKRRLP